jgi:hypothetical protein
MIELNVMCVKCGAEFPPSCVHQCEAKYDNATLNERQGTHGDYRVTADIAQRLKQSLRVDAPDAYRGMSSDQKESLEMICTKIARILSGNPNDPDHWEDIAGYANLVSERLRPA